MLITRKWKAALYGLLCAVCGALLVMGSHWLLLAAFAAGMLVRNMEQDSVIDHGELELAIAKGMKQGIDRGLTEALHG